MRILLQKEQEIVECHACLSYKLLEVLRAEALTYFSVVARAEIDFAWGWHRLQFRCFVLDEKLGAEVHTSFSAVARAEIDRLLVSKGVLLRALAGHTAWPK